jgi:hypothetical protein
LYSGIILVAICLVNLTSAVHATNESSYKYGYKTATENLTNQIVPPWDVDEDSPSPNWYVKWPSQFFMNPDICNLDSADNGCPSMGDVQAVYCTTGQIDHPQVTNSTSCLDGYVAGWKHWCTEDNYNNSKYCSDLVFGGNTKDGSDFDGVLNDESINNKTAHFQIIKNYVDSWRYFCTEDGYKNARECTIDVFVKHDFPGTFMNQNKTLLSIMPLQSLLSGSTWNFVNESNGHGLHPYPQNTATIINEAIKKERSIGLGSVGPIEVLSNITKFSGKVTFYWYQVHITTTKGIDVDYTSNPGWSLGSGNHIVLDGITPTILLKDGSQYFPSQVLTFLKISNNLIELQDKHGDTIYLTRGVNNYQAGYQYGTNEWNYYVPGGPHDNGHHFECPFSQIAPTSNFCKGYDAALAYQNSVQKYNKEHYLKNREKYQAYNRKYYSGCNPTLNLMHKY